MCGKFGGTLRHTIVADVICVTNLTDSFYAYYVHNLTYSTGMRRDPATGATTKVRNHCTALSQLQVMCYTMCPTCAFALPDTLGIEHCFLNQTL
jgi:hypothetical protein